MSDRVWTVLEILATAREYLGEKEIENPRGNAEALLGKTLGLPRIELYLQHDRPLTAEQVAGYRELLRRRVKHEPLQLILGTVEFHGVSLTVEPGLLIPRPETEGLVERVIRETAQGGTSPVRMLDIGTGTGCIAVAIAAALPEAEVDAVDLDFEAVRRTSHNAEQNGVAARVRAIRADLFSDRFESLVTPPYDVVVSNPPYVTAEEYAELSPEVRNHEPRYALVAEENGLKFYRRIANLLPTLLKPGGLLAVEIGSSQNESVSAIFADVLSTSEVHNDLAGLPRVVCGRCLSAD
jgi:release factor glutamine methyltransferase